MVRTEPDAPLGTPYAAKTISMERLWICPGAKERKIFQAGTEGIAEPQHSFSFSNTSIGNL